MTRYQLAQLVFVNIITTGAVVSKMNKKNKTNSGAAKKDSLHYSIVTHVNNILFSDALYNKINKMKLQGNVKKKQEG